MARLTRNDWFQHAAALLVERKGSGLTLDALTTAAGVTKGSFYHHFGSYDGFIEAFLEYFSVAGFSDVVSQVDENLPPREQLEELFEAIASRDFAGETAARTWAAHHPRVADAIAALDETRLAYLTNLTVPLTGSTEEGELLARRLLASYLGGLYLNPPQSAHELRLAVSAHLSTVDSPAQQPN